MIAVTWTKLSDDFGDDAARYRLSDAEFRTHVEGLLWVNRRETDGIITDRDIKRFAESRDTETAVLGLLQKGLWARRGPDIEIIHHLEHQIEHAVLAKRRAGNAERQRRKRLRDAGLLGPDPDDGLSRRDVTRDTGRDR